MGGFIHSTPKGRDKLMTAQTTIDSQGVHSGLPLLGLLALATTSFLTTLTEALPAGLLPQMGADLGVSESWAGQLITVYAIGSLLAAIPLTTATRSWRRRPLLILTIVGFAIANSVTALFDSFAVILVARFLAGVSAGLLWALMTPYAVRMAPAHLAGRAMSIALAGIPVALSLGIPAGTFIGIQLGWRVAFGLMSLMAVLLIGWVLVKVPDFAGEQKGQQFSLTKVIMMPGILPVLVTILAYILAHNILYTYIAPLLETVGTGGQTDAVLLTFGIVSLAGIAIAGATVDRALRLLTVADIGLFIVGALLLTVGNASPLFVYGAAAIWGLAFGAASTIFQTALLRSAGPAANTAAAIIVTVWNIAIAGGAFGGGVVLQKFGPSALPWSLLFLLIPALLIGLLNRAFHSTGTTSAAVSAH
jgi:predicted MFS family arabinose efflux permease